MIKIIDEQLTMTKISMGINEQEGEKEDASEDVDKWELQNVTIAEFSVKQKGAKMILRKERGNHSFKQRFERKTPARMRIDGNLNELIVKQMGIDMIH
jgi:hypothetical protein